MVLSRSQRAQIVKVSNYFRVPKISLQAQKYLKQPHLRTVRTPPKMLNFKYFVLLQSRRAQIVNISNYEGPQHYFTSPEKLEVAPTAYSTDLSQNMKAYGFCHCAIATCKTLKVYNDNWSVDLTTTAKRVLFYGVLQRSEILSLPNSVLV